MFFNTGSVFRPSFKFNGVSSTFTIPIDFILLICGMVGMQYKVQDKTFIDVQFITVQIEMSITKVKRNVSSL